MGKKFFIGILVLIIVSTPLTTAFAAYPSDGEFYEPNNEESPFIYDPIHENSSGYLSGPISTILNYQGRTYNCWDPRIPAGKKIGSFTKQLIFIPITPWVWASWKLGR